MSIGEIYGDKGSARVTKLLIAAALAKVKVDYNPNFKYGIDNRKPEYLAKFPLGQFPCFESADGSLLLNESNAIVFHFADLQSGKELLGKTINDKARVIQYAYYVETQFVPHIVSIVLPIWKILPYNEHTETIAYTKLCFALRYLNKELESKKFFVGNALTVADILVATALQYPFSLLLVEEERSKYPNLIRLFVYFHSLPEVFDITGPIKLAQFRAKYTP